VFRVAPGESIRVSNAVVLAVSPIVVEGPGADSSMVLYYEGEGRFAVWSGDSVRSSDPYWAGGSVAEARAALDAHGGVEYWLEAETSSGDRGWVLNEDRSVAEENERDPSAPWCPRTEG